MTLLKIDVFVVSVSPSQLGIHFDLLSNLNDSFQNYVTTELMSGCPGIDVVDVVLSDRRFLFHFFT